MRERRRWVGVLTLLVAVAGCDTVDRFRGGGGASAPAGGVTLSLEAPGTVQPGEESAIRLGIWNRGDTAVSAVRAELFVPAWMEILTPQPEGVEVTMVSSGEGTRLSYAAANPPLQPGESRTLVQRFRTPAGTLDGADIAPSRTVRAWLLGADGQPTGAEVSSDLTIAGAARTAEGGTGAGTGGGAAQVGGESVGALRLGMSAEEVRSRFPEARDTTWTAEGTTERGVVAPLEGGGGAAVARLENGRVGRITVAERGPRTAEGLGVGSRLEELRAAYGAACADVGETGEVVVWFQRAPGISWVLDARPPGSAEALRRDAAALPGSATVRALFVRRGTDRC